MKLGEIIQWLTNKDRMMQGADKWLHQDVDYVRNGQIVLDKLYDAVDAKLPNADRVLRSFKAQAIGPFFKEAISNPNLPVEELIKKLHSVEQTVLRVLQKYPGAHVHHFSAVSGTDIYPREWPFKDILQVGAHIETLGGSTGLSSHGTAPLTREGHLGASPDDVVAHTDLPRMASNPDAPLKMNPGGFSGSQDLGIESTGGLMMPLETQGGKIYWSDKLIDPVTGQFRPEVTPQAAAQALTPTSIEPQRMLADVAYNNPIEALSRRVMLQALPEGMDPNDLTQWQFANKMLKGLGLDLNQIRKNLTHNLGSGSLKVRKGLKLPNLEVIREFARKAIIDKQHAVSTLPNVTELKQLGGEIAQSRASGASLFGVNPLTIGAMAQGATKLGGWLTDFIPSQERAEQLASTQLAGKDMTKPLVGYGLDSGKNVGMSMLMGKGAAMTGMFSNPVTAAAGLTIGGGMLTKSLVDAASGITRAHYPSHTDDPRDSYGLYGNTKAANLKVLEDQRKFAQQMEPKTSQTAATKLGDAVEKWATNPINELKYIKNQTLDWLTNLVIE